MYGFTAKLSDTPSTTMGLINKIRMIMIKSLSVLVAYVKTKYVKHLQYEEEL